MAKETPWLLAKAKAAPIHEPMVSREGIGETEWRCGIGERALGVMDNIIISTPEARTGLQIRAKVVFAELLQAFGWHKVTFGGEILPRARWAKVTAATLAELGVIDAKTAEVVEVVLSGSIGNSSQLGNELVKEGKMTREGADTAAQSLSALLAARAKAKAEAEAAAKAPPNA